MTSIRRLAIVAAVVVVFGVSSAHAHRVGFASARLGAGDGVTLPCDPDGVGVSLQNTYSTSSVAYLVQSVTVSGIAAACNEHRLTITLRNASGTSLWQGSTTVAGTSTVLSVSGVASASVQGWALATQGA